MKLTLTLSCVAKLRKFLDLLPSGSCRVFTQARKNFGLGIGRFLESFYTNSKSYTTSQPTASRRRLARPSAPTAREPAPP